MGVSDLMSWMRKAHPKVQESLYKRWDDPRVAGKRVAIDATLLTHSFHFGRRQETVGLEGKGAIIGWYQLITSMRASGVKPIAIWDKKGAREWKAAEARKRLANRALALARKQHEDERVERLSELRERIKEFESMDEVEKRMIQFQWKSSERLGMASILKPPIVSEVPTDVAIERDTGVPEPTKPVKPISPASIRAAESRELGETQDVQTASGETENTDPAIAAFERATEYLDSLSTVLDSYRRSYRPPIRRTTSRDTHNELEDVIDHVKELEDLEHSLGEVTRDGATIERDLEDNPPADDGEMAIIDEKLKELLPAESYTETKRQSELTHAEGQLINLLLSPSSVSEDAETYEITVNGETQEMGTPLQRVEELIERAPEVRDTYIRQLATPKTSDHEDCRELLVKMGVPVLQAEAPFEAEGLGASLVKAGLVDYVGTEDSDILAMSGPMLRNLSAASRPLLHISGTKLQTLSNLSPESFLDFCILLGTDASPRIPSIGPANAFKLISKHGTIETILDSEPRVLAKLGAVGGKAVWMDMVNKARGVFRDLPEIPEGVELEEGVWNDEEVDEFLEKKHGIRMMDPADVDEGRFEELEEERNR